MPRAYETKDEIRSAIEWLLDDRNECHRMCRNDTINCTDRGLFWLLYDRVALLKYAIAEYDRLRAFKDWHNYCFEKIFGPDKTIMELRKDWGDIDEVITKLKEGLGDVTVGYYDVHIYGESERILNYVIECSNQSVEPYRGWFCQVLQVMLRLRENFPKIDKGK